MSAANQPLDIDTQACGSIRRVRFPYAACVPSMIMMFGRLFDEVII